MHRNAIKFGVILMAYGAHHSLSVDCNEPPLTTTSKQPTMSFRCTPVLRVSAVLS